MCRSLYHAGKKLFVRERRIEIPDRIHGVEQAQEMHLCLGTTEGRLEALHVPLMLLGGLEPPDAHLVLLVRPIQEWHQLLVPLGQQSRGGDHPSEETGGECTPGETENEDLVMGFVVTHYEAVAGDDVVVEADAESEVECLGHFPIEAAPEAHVDGLVAGDVGPDTGCVRSGSLILLPLGVRFGGKGGSYVDNSGIAPGHCGRTSGTA